MKGSIINLTPHDISYCDQNGKAICSIPSAGSIRLVEDIDNAYVDTTLNIRVVRRPQYIGIDKPHLLTQSHCIIVSMIVAQWMSERKEYKNYKIYAPDTGPDGAVRDDKGRITGCKRLVCYQ